jgi:hypothetical protein
MTTKEISAFWIWFKSISESLYLNIKSPAYTGLIDEKIRKLGRFDWEMGSVNDELMFFAISPNLDADLFSVTEEIVSYAPECKNWTFLSSKPRKEYTPEWRMTDDRGNWMTVDTSSWLYVLYYFEDGTFDMDLQMNSFDLGEKQKTLALDIVLTNILGEEDYMHLVQHVKIVDHFEDHGKATPIKHLHNHITNIRE